MYAYMHVVCLCVYAVQEQCWNIIHFLRACSIFWLVQSVPTLQKAWKRDWVHSRIRNLPSSEKLPARYTIGPLQRRIWHIGCLLTKLCNCMHIQFSALPLSINLSGIAWCTDLVLCIHVWLMHAQLRVVERLYADTERMTCYIPYHLSVTQLTTSDFSEKSPSVKDSKASHFTGNLTAWSFSCLK